MKKYIHVVIFHNVLFKIQSIYWTTVLYKRDTNQKLSRYVSLFGGKCSEVVRNPMTKITLLLFLLHKEWHCYWESDFKFFQIMKLFLKDHNSNNFFFGLYTQTGIKKTINTHMYDNKIKEITVEISCHTSVRNWAPQFARPWFRKCATKPSKNPENRDKNFPEASVILADVPGEADELNHPKVDNWTIVSLSDGCGCVRYQGGRLNSLSMLKFVVDHQSWWEQWVGFRKQSGGEFIEKEIDTVFHLWALEVVLLSHANFCQGALVSP